MLKELLGAGVGGGADGKEHICQRRARPLGREDPLEEGVTAHSRILAWRIPWTGGPGRLQSRTGHDQSNSACTRVCTRAHAHTDTRARAWSEVGVGRPKLETRKAQLGKLNNKGKHKVTVGNHPHTNIVSKSATTGEYKHRKSELHLKSRPAT